MASFWRISKCAHKMSPMKGGAKDRNSSLVMEHSCLPLIWRLATKLSTCKPCNENSLMAQLSHWDTCSRVHCLGSRDIPSLALSESQVPYVVLRTSPKLLVSGRAEAESVSDMSLRLGTFLTLFTLLLLLIWAGTGTGTCDVCSTGSGLILVTS